MVALTGSSLTVKQILRANVMSVSCSTPSTCSDTQVPPVRVSLDSIAPN